MQYNYTRLVNDKDEQKLYEALDSLRQVLILGLMMRARHDLVLAQQ